MEADESWDQNTDAYDEAKALALYTTIIDVPSISAARSGWQVLCKENADLVRETTLNSRIVTVFGEKPCAYFKLTQLRRIQEWKDVVVGTTDVHKGTSVQVVLLEL
jgi:hypothetical protein